MAKSYKIDVSTIDFAIIDTPRQLREKAGLSVEQLADATKLTETTIKNVESGATKKPRSSTVSGYVDAFDGADREELERVLYRRSRNSVTAPEPQMRIEERLMQGRYGRAAFCAYLAGDFSVLLTKQAIAAPVNAFIHASVDDADETDVRMYYHSVEAPGHWQLDEEYSSLIKERLSDAFRSGATRFRLPSAISVVLVSELPKGSALYEESAIVLAVATAMSRHAGAAEPDNFKTLSLAAHFLRQWYTDVSWGTLSICSYDPAKLDRKLLKFDRRRDGGVKLFDIYRQQVQHRRLAGLTRQLERNFAPKRKFWKTTPHYLPKANIQIWWDGSEATFDESVVVGQPLQDFARQPFGQLLKEMSATIVRNAAGCDRKLGFMLQLHQLMLASVDFGDTKVQMRNAALNGLAGFVLGAKSASGRISGPFVVMVDREANRDLLAAAMKRLGMKPIDEYRCAINLRPNGNGGALPNRRR